jgi:hypothetical protein
MMEEHSIYLLMANSTHVDQGSQSFSSSLQLEKPLAKFKLTTSPSGINLCLIQKD